MFSDDLSEFDDSREVVQQVMDEYIAAESPGYVSYGAAASGGAAAAAASAGGAPRMAGGESIGGGAAAAAAADPRAPARAEGGAP